MALLSMREREGARALLEEVTYVELSDRADFNYRFVLQALAFPQGGGFAAIRRHHRRTLPQAPQTSGHDRQFGGPDRVRGDRHVCVHRQGRRATRPVAGRAQPAPAKISGEVRRWPERWPAAVDERGRGGTPTAGTRRRPRRGNARVARLPGLHRYDLYAGPDGLEQMLAEQPGTYLFTDFLVRSFARTVVEQVGSTATPSCAATTSVLHPRGVAGAGAG